MSYYKELPQKLWKYCDLPVKGINKGVWNQMCLYLNPEKLSFGKKFGNLQDWRGVAKCLGYDPLQITNFQLTENPMGKVIDNISEDVTLGDVLLTILRCERYDLLEDAVLLQRLEKCLMPVALKEADDGMHDMFYHAMVCHSRYDISFVKVLITELEDRHHLKLCIPERDFVAGGSIFEALAKAIKNCRKVIVILSPEFLESEECNFMLSLSLSVDPSAKRRKIIPIIYKQCQVPDSMAALASVDYSRQDVIAWFWNRLKTTLLLENDFSLSSSLSIPENPTSSSTISDGKLTSIAEAEPTVTTKFDVKGFFSAIFKKRCPAKLLS